MSDIIVTSLNAMTLISILMLVSMGLAIIYGLMNVINLAHGEFVTIGAYTLAMVQAWGGDFGSRSCSLPSSDMHSARLSRPS